MDPTLIITTLVTLLGRVVPAVATPANAALIEEIVQALVALGPVLVKEYQDLIPVVQNIIQALGEGPLTDAQTAALDILEQQCDTAFEAAAAAKGLPPPATPAAS